MFTGVAIAIALAATEPAPAAPPPDPATEGQRALAASGVCAGACLAGSGVVALGFSSGSLPLVAGAPVVGLVVAAAGAAWAESALMPSATPPQPPKARLWVPMWASAGCIAVGGAAAVGGYVLGNNSSSDAGPAFGAIGAVVAGTIGGAVGAGIGTFVGLRNEPPDF